MTSLGPAERRRWSFIVLVPMFASSCALIADLGDRTLGDLKGTKDSSTPTTKDSQPDPDPDDSSASLPSFCDGITLYASFDDKLTGDRNGSAVFSIGGVSNVAQGKFGGGLSLVASTADPAAGAQLFFVTDGGVSPWPVTGSLSVWFRSTGTPQIPVLYRPVATVPPYTTENPARFAGLGYYLRFAPANEDLVGLTTTVNGLQSPFLMVDSGDTTTYLKPNEFNHFFTAWNQSSAPTAVMALNGGLGKNFGGGADVTYANGQTPFKATSTNAWAAERATGVRLGGSSNNSPEGIYDDLVIWNRVLSFAEVASVYNSNAPVGTTCKLR